MSADYETVLDELKHLRKQSRAIHECPAIVRILGGGDVREAYNALVSITASIPDSIDTRIALSSLIADGAVIDKFNSISERFLEGIDQRSVRPYSDRGLAKIAKYITSEDVLFPVVDLYLTQVDHERFAFRVRHRVEADVFREWNPSFTLNGEKLDVSITILEAEDRQDSDLLAHQVVARTELNYARLTTLVMSYADFQYPLTVRAYTRTVGESSWVCSALPRAFMAQLVPEGTRIRAARE